MKTSEGSEAPPPPARVFPAVTALPTAPPATHVPAASARARRRGGWEPPPPRHRPRCASLAVGREEPVAVLTPPRTMAVAYLLGNGSAPLLAGALEVPFGANASAAAACRPAVPPCVAAPPGSWGNNTAGWNRSEPCGGANGSAGGGPCAPAGGGGPSVVTAIAIMALYSVVCVVGLFGNFLVMYVIIR